MVTYPSTHGVFEDTITELCALVHDAGGQVYVDGANLNALVGLAQPGRFGADVCHLNLHKTFCIPHGGGGPGVGPVGVRAHLAPYLPNHPLDAGRRPRDGRRPGVRRAVRLGGHPADLVGLRPADGRRRPAPGDPGGGAERQLRRGAAARALPGALLGRDGLVAHECILDLRGITKDTGVTVDDVAKRLIDYGFHAPTMSFPVAGTLMVEPTESEDLGELDRFCDAMIAIRAEIDEVGSGAVGPEDNPLRGAPHTARPLAGEWDHPYDREDAPPSRPVSTRRRSTGRRCAASTARTATATWSAPARRRRPSRTEPRAGASAGAGGRRPALAVRTDGAAAGALVDDDLAGDAGAQVGDVADDPDGPSALAQGVEHGEHLLEALVVEAAEALVDEQRAQVEAAGLLAHRVGQPEGQGERGHERLAAGQGGGLAGPAGPLVEDPQAEAAAGPSGGQVVGVLEPVAAGSHDGEPLVGQLGDLLEPGREHERRQPHPQRVVGSEAAHRIGQLADPGVRVGGRTRDRARSSIGGSSRWRPRRARDGSGRPGPRAAPSREASASASPARSGGSAARAARPQGPRARPAAGPPHGRCPRPPAGPARPAGAGPPGRRLEVGEAGRRRGGRGGRPGADA